MKKMIVLGGVAVLAMSGAALAQTDSDGQRGWRMDPNARVSQAEFVDRRVARLTTMDANSDGVVAREEMQAQRQARMAERRSQMFERMDADSDGSITRAEYDAAHAQRMEQRAERGEAGERRGGRGHRGDLLVTVSVIVPKKASKEQRKLMEQLHALLPKEKFEPTPVDSESDKGLFDRVKDIFG